MIVITADDKTRFFGDDDELSDLGHLVTQPAPPVASPGTPAITPPVPSPSVIMPGAPPPPPVATPAAAPAPAEDRPYTLETATLYDLATYYKYIKQHVEKELHPLYNMDLLWTQLRKSKLATGNTVENYIKTLQPKATDKDIDNILRSALSFYDMPLPAGKQRSDLVKVSRDLISAIQYAAQIPSGLDPTIEKLLELTNQIRNIYAISDPNIEKDRMRILNEILELPMSTKDGKKKTLSKLYTNLATQSGSEGEVVLRALIRALIQYTGQDFEGISQMFQNEVQKELKLQSKRSESEESHLRSTGGPAKLEPFVSGNPDDVGAPPEDLYDKEGGIIPDKVLSWYKNKRWGGEERVNQAIKYWNDTYNGIIKAISQDEALLNDFKQRHLPVEEAMIVPYGDKNLFDQPVLGHHNFDEFKRMLPLFRALTVPPPGESLSPLKKEQHQFSQRVKTYLQQNGINIEGPEFFTGAYRLEPEMVDPYRYGITRQSVYDALVKVSEQRQAPSSKKDDGGKIDTKKTYAPEKMSGEESITTGPVKKTPRPLPPTNVFQGLRNIFDDPESVEMLKNLKRRDTNGIVATDYTDIYENLTEEQKNALRQRSVFIAPVARHGPRSRAGISFPLEDKEPLENYTSDPTPRPRSLWNELMNAAVDATFKGQPWYDPEVKPDAPGQIYYDIGKMLANSTSIDVEGPEVIKNVRNIEGWVSQNIDKLRAPLPVPDPNNPHSRVQINELKNPNDRFKAKMYDAVKTTVKMLANMLMDEGLYAKFVDAVKNNPTIQGKNPEMYNHIVNSMPSPSGATTAQSTLKIMIKRAGLMFSNYIFGE